MPSNRIFVTGASGFIGRALLEQVRVDGLETVRALSRSAQPQTTGVEWVQGDLAKVEAWAPRLAGCDTLLHLGASTGRASAREHDLVNLRGTRSLVRAARDAGVGRVVFVSTIAAAYPEVDRYPYAAAKRRAEEVVSAGALGWTILRPTIVLGQGGGIGPKLLDFAKRARTPLFGDGNVRVQPIGERDVARLILEAMRDPATLRQTIDLGGPDVITFAELLRRLRGALGQKPEKFLRLPLRPAMSTLWIVERCLGPRLPVLAGQLYAFRYDSTARSSNFLDQRMPKIARIDALIAELARGAGHA